MLGIGHALDVSVTASTNLTSAISAAVNGSTLSSQVETALLQAVPILVQLAGELGFPLHGFHLSKQQRQPLVAKYVLPLRARRGRGTVLTEACRAASWT